MPLPPPSVASRRGLSGLFVDFDLLPELLQIAAAGDGSREGVTSDWSARLERGGFTDADIDPEDGPERISVADSVAADAWRFAERMALLDSAGLTPEGRRLVSLAGSRDLPTARHAMVQVLAKGVTRQLRGQGGVEVLPFLHRGAGALTATDNLWARQCPGLLPVEVSSLIHWANVEVARAEKLLSNLVTWRDVAMHPYEAPQTDVEPGANSAHHFDVVSAFYLSQPWLGERVPISFAEELATCRLLSYCGLLQMVEVADSPACWLVENEPPGKSGGGC